MTALADAHGLDHALALRRLRDLKGLRSVPERQAYLATVEQDDGPTVHAIVKAEFSAWWHASRTPAPAQQQAAAARTASVHPGEPGVGSFLATADQDHSNPVCPVDSGVSA